MVLLDLVLLDDRDFLLILVELDFLVSDKITEFHLLLNEILGLSEGPNELLTLLFLHIVHFLLMLDANSPEVLLFELQLNLLLAELLPQTLLLLVQVQEDLNISIELSLLLILDYLFDLALFHDFLLLFLQELKLFLCHLHLDFSLDLSELLSLLSYMLVHAYLHLIQVLLIDLSSFPEAQASLRTLHCRLRVCPRCQLNLLTIHETLLQVIPNRQMHKPFIKEHGLEAIMVAHFILVLLCADEAAMLLPLLDGNHALEVDVCLGFLINELQLEFVKDLVHFVHEVGILHHD